MCDIQYKGQLSKEQVRERVGKYPLEDPATQEESLSIFLCMGVRGRG